jgi:hypothetical protein
MSGKEMVGSEAVVAGSLATDGGLVRCGAVFSQGFVRARVFQGTAVINGRTITP